MNLKKKISILALASTLCLAVGAVCVNTQTTTASADEVTGAMTMAAGAAVNKTSDYGGIRWTTTVEQNFQPVSGTTAYNFGTFVIPTATYEAEKAADATKKIEDMQGAMNIRYKYDAQSESWTALDTAKSGFTYYSAIKYDDIVEDYKNAYQNTTKTDADILKAAYKLELTAVSYAYDGTTYHYVDVTDVSRSARQVANAALLAGELEADQGVEASVKTTVQGYVGGAENIVTGTTSAGYLDLTEIKAGTEQTLTVDKSAYTDLDWANVQEIAVGAKGVEKSVDTDTDTITIAEAPEDLTTYENGKFAYVAAFTADGVYNIPAIAADGVISSEDDVTNKLGGRGTISTQTGYYVLTQNITYTTQPTWAASKYTGGLENAIFDGQGYTIANFKGTRGLFGTAKNSTIRNVGIVGEMNNASGGSSLVAQTITDCELENVYVEVTGWASNYIGSPLAYTFKDNIMRNCVVSTTTLTARQYIEGNTTYHRRSIGSITNGTDAADFQTNKFTNCYVLSGMPLSMYVSARPASYAGITGMVGVKYTDNSGNEATAQYFQVGSGDTALDTGKDYDGQSQIVDTLAEDDIVETKANGTARERTITLTHIDNSALTTPQEVTLTIKGNVSTTKKIYKTGRGSEAQAYRYFDYTSYAQIGNDDGNTIKRYDNKDAMKADAANNATELATYDTNYWTVNTANGTLTWKNA